jgi:hypothetical protein
VIGNSESSLRGNSRDSYKQKITQLEKLLELDHFIALPRSPDAISHIGMTQSLWVAVMGNNPSHFKEKRFCPKTHTIIHGIQVCPDLPPERVILKSEGKKDSVEEFLVELNGIYEKAGLDTRFRLQTMQEFIWASRGNSKTQYVSGQDQSELWKYAAYSETSHLDPLVAQKDPQFPKQPSPSGIHQTHPVQAKLSNSYGFYRSGVWEWTQDVHTIKTHYFLVGGGYSFGPQYSATGYHFPYWQGSRYDYVGFRLVQIKKK